MPTYIGRVPSVLVQQVRCHRCHVERAIQGTQRERLAQPTHSRQIQVLPMSVKVAIYGELEDERRVDGVRSVNVMLA